MKIPACIGRRLAFWPLLCFTLGLAVWWCCHLPYDEDTLYRSIPSTATLISEHDRPAARWSEVCGHYAVQVALDRLGIGPRERHAVARNANVRWLLDRFAARKAVVAYIPELGSRGESAWIVASWAGGRIQFLRSGVLCRMLPVLKPRQLDNGLRIWVVDRADMGGARHHLSVAAVDGVMLACLSDDPEAVRYLVRRAHGRAPMTGAHFSAGIGQSVRWEGMDDRLWVGPGLLLGAWGRSELRVGFDTSEPDRVKGVVRQPVMPTGDRVGRGPGALAAVRRALPSVLQVCPDLYMLSTMGDAESWGLPQGLSVATASLAEWCPALSVDTPVAFALYGGALSSRLLGLRVPTLLVGVHSTDAPAIFADIEGILDRVNAEMGWGLLPRPLPDHAGAPVIIDTSRGGVYDSLEVTQRPALVTRGDWIWLASNVQALDHLLHPDPAAAAPAWQPPPVLGTPPRVYGWSDLATAGQSIRDALAVGALALLASNAPDRADVTERLGKVRDIVETVQGLGECQVELRVDRGEREIAFECRVPDKKP